MQRRCQKQTQMGQNERSANQLEIVIFYSMTRTQTKAKSENRAIAPTWTTQSSAETARQNYNRKSATE